MKIGFLFKKSMLGFGNLDLISKVTVEHNYNLRKKMACLFGISIQELMDRMLPNLHSCRWESTKEFILFDYMHNIFKVLAGHYHNCQHRMVWVVEGHLFSLKTLCP